MNVRILEFAIQDLIDGHLFYESHQQGIGEYFLDSLFADLYSLQIFAGIHPIHFGYQRTLSKRFPFAIYYKVVNNEALVYAILDCRRNPAWIRKRLRTRT